MPSIDLDQMALLAAEKRVTGSNSHVLRSKMQAYINACYIGDEKMAEDAKREMRDEVIRDIRNDFRSGRLLGAQEAVQLPVCVAKR